MNPIPLPNDQAQPHWPPLELEPGKAIVRPVSAAAPSSARDRVPTPPTAHRENSAYFPPPRSAFGSPSAAIDSEAERPSSAAPAAEWTRFPGKTTCGRCRLQRLVRLGEFMQDPDATPREPRPLHPTDDPASAPTFDESDSAAERPSSAAPAAAGARTGESRRAAGVGCSA